MICGYEVVSKPSLENFTSYVPIGRSARLNEPSFLVVAESSRFVATARALTIAPGRTAPLLSVTVPFIDPRVCWAHERLVQRTKAASASKRAPEDRWRHTSASYGDLLTAESPFKQRPLCARVIAERFQGIQGGLAQKLLKIQ